MFNDYTLEKKSKAKKCGTQASKIIKVNFKTNLFINLKICLRTFSAPDCSIDIPETLFLHNIVKADEFIITPMKIKSYYFELKRNKLLPTLIVINSYLILKADVKTEYYLLMAETNDRGIIISIPCITQIRN